MPQNHYDMGVAVGDYDNDGFEDIYITGYGGNTLYHNTERHLHRRHQDRRCRGWGWSASAGFSDYDNDGKLDLFVTRYVNWTFKTNRYCGGKTTWLSRLLPPSTTMTALQTSCITTTATVPLPTFLKKPVSLTQR
jgi:hypothetical protein